MGNRDRSRRAEGTHRTRVEKRITSDLSKVSPVLVVHGRWSDKELQTQAEHVAIPIAYNAGFNCCDAKVVLVSGSWPQRDAFIQRLKAVMSPLPPRRAYYPRAEEHYECFLSAYPSAEATREKRPGQIPPTLIMGIDPSNREVFAFHVEPQAAGELERVLNEFEQMGTRTQILMQRHNCVLNTPASA